MVWGAGGLAVPVPVATAAHGRCSEVTRTNAGGAASRAWCAHLHRCAAGRCLSSQDVASCPSSVGVPWSAREHRGPHAQALGPCRPPRAAEPVARRQRHTRATGEASRWARRRRCGPTRLRCRVPARTAIHRCRACRSTRRRCTSHDKAALHPNCGSLNVAARTCSTSQSPPP